ncbi:hypothetical protein Hypma_003853 [Hypsizygus marmoreus]|uniref:HNH nuclease domain-containing protein n=1 Tax=Hypsizygus marmoreus TaxID=39966 RepID=A0A369JYX6_HYPMA|nr:hypothetical protein Hypma_003853 [Hypsizygus marmoreus]
MTALPRQLPARYEESATMNSAYSIILKLETKENSNRAVMYARILGYLLLEGPTDEARSAIANEIVSCKNDEALAANGKFYLDHLIRIFKKGKGPTPSSHVSPPSFDALKDIVAQCLEKPIVNYEDAKAKALARDGYRCLASGTYDLAAERVKELRDRVIMEKAETAETNCAHIFPESTNLNLSTDKDCELNRKHVYATSVWAVLDRFGYENLRFDLNGNNIHRLENVLTLSTNVHGKFDTLKVWFEAVENKENTYKLNSTWDGHLNSLYPGEVTFTTPDSNLPLPSPTYLHIHATCCKVAHLSGAGEYLDEIHRKFDDSKVLSQDGSSAEMFSHALLPLSNEIPAF